MKRGSTLAELCLELEKVFWFRGTERDGAVFVTVWQTTLQTNTFCTAYHLVYVCLKSMYYIRISKSGILKGIPFNLRCSTTTVNSLSQYWISVLYIYMCGSVKNAIQNSYYRLCQQCERIDPYKSYAVNIVLFATFIYWQVNAGRRSEGVDRISLFLSTRRLNLRYLVASYCQNIRYIRVTLIKFLLFLITTFSASN